METPDPVNLDLDFASYHSSVSAKDNLSTTSAICGPQVEIPAEKAPHFAVLKARSSPTKKAPPYSRSSDNLFFLTPAENSPRASIAANAGCRPPITRHEPLHSFSARSARVAL